MKPSDVADLLIQALHEKYRTGLAWVNYDEEFSMIDISWVDGSQHRVDIAVRHLAAGDARWRRLEE